MRSDILLVASVGDEALEFLARDVPTGVFFAGFQDTFPGAECFARLSVAEQWDNRRGFETWADDLLCHAMLEPRLTRELVQRTGEARDQLVTSYLWAIGYDTPAAAARERLVPPQRVPQGPAEPTQASTDDALLLHVPTPNIRMALRQLAAKARTHPLHVWQDWTITEFLWTWHVALEDDLKDRTARADAKPSLMDRIGREPS